MYFHNRDAGIPGTDAEVAVILAHELIHADKRHVMIQTARCIQN